MWDFWTQWSVESWTCVKALYSEVRLLLSLSVPNGRQFSRVSGKAVTAEVTATVAQGSHSTWSIRDNLYIIVVSWSLSISARSITCCSLRFSGYDLTRLQWWGDAEMGLDGALRWNKQVCLLPLYHEGSLLKRMLPVSCVDHRGLFAMNRSRMRAHRFFAGSCSLQLHSHFSKHIILFQLISQIYFSLCCSMLAKGAKSRLKHSVISWRKYDVPRPGWWGTKSCTPISVIQLDCKFEWHFWSSLRRVIQSMLNAMLGILLYTPQVCCMIYMETTQIAQEFPMSTSMGLNAEICSPTLASLFPVRFVDTSGNLNSLLWSLQPGKWEPLSNTYHVFIDYFVCDLCANYMQPQDLPWPPKVHHVRKWGTALNICINANQCEEMGGCPQISNACSCSLYNVFGAAILAGFSSAVETLCGMAYGAKDYVQMGVLLQRALIMSSSTFLLLVALWNVGMEPFLRLAGQLDTGYLPIPFTYIILNLPS